MKQIDLISTDDLINELMARSDGLALVFAVTDEGNKPKIRTKWSADADCVLLIGMSEVLKYQLEKEYLEAQEI